MKKRKKSSVVWFLDKTALEKLVRESDSLGKVLSHFGLINKGGNPRTLKRRLEADGIDYSHMKMGLASNKNRRLPKSVVPLEMVMIENSTFSRSQLKKRLIKDKLIPYECQECGQEPKWNGKPLSLILDHKNGVWNDNRKDNLRFLCPNCNSQTETFAAKNKKLPSRC